MIRPVSLFTLLVVLSGPAVAAGEMVGHRAFYDMALDKSRSGSGLASARGGMVYSIEDTCDGWAIQNKTALTLVYQEGGSMRSTWDYLTWESKDGLTYRFRVQSARNGQMVERIDGTAALKGPLDGGAAVFEQPEEKTVDLPAGTLFPSEHTALLLDSARQGDRIVTRKVFDGSAMLPPYDVTAVIGGGAPGDAHGREIESSLLDSPSWRMQLAFYEAGAEAAVPDYEVGLRYHANGVAQNVVQQFDDFSLRGTLTKIEPLDPPDC